MGLVVLPSIVDLVLGHIKKSDDCGVSLVVDGDTVTIHCTGSGEERARIIGFDAPEIKARCFGEYKLALRAKWMLRTRIWMAKNMAIERKGRDRYNRALIEMKIDGRPVGESMILAGLARAYDGGQRAAWCKKT